MQLHPDFAPLAVFRDRHIRKEDKGDAGTFTRGRHISQRSNVFPFIACLAVPNGPEYVPRVQYPQKLVLRGGLVKVRSLFIHKECVWHPNQLDVLCPDNQLLKIWLFVKRQSWISPELAEVHVQGEVL